MTEKELKEKIVELSSIIMKDVKEELSDKETYKKTCKDTAKKLSAVIKVKSEAINVVDKRCKEAKKLYNDAKSKYVNELELQKIDFETFASKVDPTRERCEKLEKTHSYLSAELQNWKHVYYQMNVGEDKVGNIVSGALLAKYITLVLLSSIMGTSKPTNADEEAVMKLGEVIVNSDVLNIPEGTEITREFLEEKLKDVMVNSMEYQRDRSILEMENMRKSVAHYADEFKLEYDKDPEELKKKLGNEALDDKQVKSLLNDSLFRAVEEFVIKMKETNGENEIRNLSKAELNDLFILVTTAKRLFAAGVEDLLNIDVSYLRPIMISHMYSNYTNRMKPYAEKIIAKTDNKNLIDYGVDKLSMLLTSVYFSLFISEQVSLIFSIAY